MPRSGPLRGAPPTVLPDPSGFPFNPGRAGAYKGACPTRTAAGPALDPTPMLETANKALRTLLLLALVALLGWWTLFLRGKLTGHEEQLAEKNQEVISLGLDLAESEKKLEQLGTDLAMRDETIAGLNDSLVAKDAELALKDEAIGELEEDNAEKAERIVVLTEELSLSQAEVEALTAAIALLKIDRRVARLEVLAHEPDPADPARTRTRLTFTELDATGEAVGPARELTVDGTRVYLEALVIKFDDDYVEEGDFLRGSSVCLFQRVFGEAQSPADGVAIEPSGTLPAVYGGDELPAPFYRELWQRFWEYAEDPDAAAALGVRAIHGEAPFIESKPGKSYRVELRASGGLSITPE